MPREIPKAYEPQEIEERWAKSWFDEKLFRAENSGDGPSILDCPAAAEHHRIDSHRAHARAHADRHAGSLASHARAPHALAARHGSRGNRDAIRRGTPTGEGENPASGPWTRGIRAPRVEVEGGERRRHQGADDPPGSVVRLDAREIHSRARALSCGAGSVSAPLPRRTDLPRAIHGELVPALPNRDQRPGSGAHRAAGEAVAHSLSDCGRDDRSQQVSGGGHHAARNDARRHRRRGASG